MSYLLYDYFRSTASYRVRIALNLKNINYELKQIHLVNQGGEQHLADYSQRNPQQLVPLLEDKQNGLLLNQSIAIIEYLDTFHPEPSLYPSNNNDKAMAKSIALQIACDIHPLNNLRVLKYLTGKLNINEDQKMTWYHHWLKTGFDALEKQLSQQPGDTVCCIGNQITIADICLIPQIYNAHRFEFDMSAYPRLSAINEYCLSLSEFDKATPENNKPEV